MQANGRWDLIRRLKFNTGDPYPEDTGRESCARLNWCVSAVGEVEVPVFVCLRSNCNHMTERGGPYILLYPH